MRMEKVLEEVYEEIIIGFLLELEKQNVDGREIGRELAKITQILGVWDK